MMEKKYEVVVGRKGRKREHVDYFNSVLSIWRDTYASVGHTRKDVLIHRVRSELAESGFRFLEWSKEANDLVLVKNERRINYTIRRALQRLVRKKRQNRLPEEQLQKRALESAASANATRRDRYCESSSQLPYQLVIAATGVPVLPSRLQVGCTSKNGTRTTKNSIAGTVATATNAATTIQQKILPTLLSSKVCSEGHWINRMSAAECPSLVRSGNSNGDSTSVDSATCVTFNECMEAPRSGVEVDTEKSSSKDQESPTRIKHQEEISPFLEPRLSSWDPRASLVTVASPKPTTTTTQGASARNFDTSDDGIDGAPPYMPPLLERERSNSPSTIASFGSMSSPEFLWEDLNQDTLEDWPTDNQNWDDTRDHREEEIVSPLIHNHSKLPVKGTPSSPSPSASTPRLVSPEKPTKSRRSLDDCGQQQDVPVFSVMDFNPIPDSVVFHSKTDKNRSNDGIAINGSSDLRQIFPPVNLEQEAELSKRSSTLVFEANNGAFQFSTPPPQKTTMIHSISAEISNPVDGGTFDEHSRAQACERKQQLGQRTKKQRTSDALKTVRITNSSDEKHHSGARAIVFDETAALALAKQLSKMEESVRALVACQYRMKERLDALDD